MFPPLTRLRRRVGSGAVDGFFRGASALGKLHPNARPDRHGVEVIRDIPYVDDGEATHLLDVYRPVERAEPLPAVLYIHGGGFRILSKDSHWVMGLALSRVGCVVFNISYRLAPRHPFPAALRDCAAAFEWVLDHAADYGADPTQLVIAGESAGANLTTALTVMSCYERPEPWARPVWDRAAVPAAIVPSCGVFQVSEPERFRRRNPRLPSFVNDRLHEVHRAYLGAEPSVYGETLDLADPVVLLERGEAPARPLPPCLAAVGTRDPLLDDTRRLEAAYTALGYDCEARYYKGEIHAFQAFAWRREARRYWGDTYRFLARHVPLHDPP